MLVTIFTNRIFTGLGPFILTFLVMTHLVSCGAKQNDEQKGNEQKKLYPVSVRLPFYKNSDCPRGGIKISSGVDKNQNGILDPDEIESRRVECD